MVANHSDSRKGILFMLLGMSLFTLNDALGKWLVSTYPVAMLLAIRSLFGVMLLLPLIQREGWRRTFAVDRLPLHLVRVLCVSVEVACFYWAVRSLPLANVLTLYMAAPLVVTALSVPILREKVGWRRWAAVLVGFTGVVVVLNPTGDFALLPSLVAVTGSCIFSLGLVITRVLRESSSISLLAYQNFGTGLLGAAALPVTGFVMPGDGFWLSHFWLLGALGITSLAGHAAMNRSLQLSPASVVVPYQYVSILWAVLLDWIFWATAPTMRIGVGAALIIGSGLFVFYRERSLDQGAATVPAVHDAPGSK